MELIRNRRRKKKETSKQASIHQYGNDASQRKHKQLHKGGYGICTNIGESSRKNTRMICRLTLEHNGGDYEVILQVGR
jgi:hypothetical protein